MAENWQRPPSVHFPSVWSHCEGKTPLANGKIPKFRIQDVPEEMFEEVIEHMVKLFLLDEPYISVLRVHEDPDAVAEVQELWRWTLNHRCALLALLDNPEDFEGLNLPKIAGCNMTMPVSKNDKDPEIHTWQWKSVLGFVNEASHSVDVYEKYNVSVQMYALGLSVDPAYRGQGLGQAIVNARFLLGKAVGLPLTTTVFTGTASQAIGRKCGFELLGELYPENYKENGVEVFKGVRSKSIQFMAAPIQS